MTPTEARKELLRNGFHSKWEGRRLSGGSHYKPGNPGVFEGIRFVLTLQAPGECEVEVTDFDDETRKLEPTPNPRSLAGGDKKDLEWAVQAILRALAEHLDPGKRDLQPLVPLGAALDATQAFPDATTEEALFTRLLFMSKETEDSYREALERTGHRDELVGVEPTEESLIEGDLAPKMEPQVIWVPPVKNDGNPKAIGVISPHQKSYGADRDRTPAKQRDFHWAPLSELALWSQHLKPVAPFHQLSTPREMTTVVFMSAVRQVIDVLPEYFDLVIFGTDPIDDKLTACLLGTTWGFPKARKPQWILDRAIPAELGVWDS